AHSVTSRPRGSPLPARPARGTPGGSCRRTDGCPPGVRDEHPGSSSRRPSATDFDDRRPLRQPLRRRHGIAGHDPPKTPVVDGFGLWSWMLPPPPPPPPSLWGKVPSSVVI